TLHLELWEKAYDCAKPDRSPEERFGNVIRNAYEKTGKKVAILIDEYDKPLLSAVNNEKLADDYRSLLKAFYGNLKSMDAYIEIGVITGVARFSKVSIFSDLNNLRDISFENEFSGICGITSDELDSCFSESIANLAIHENVSMKEIRNILRENYDGYHFSKKSPDIYNPFSLINVFAKMDIGEYWFESGTPTYLVRLIENEKWLLRDLAPTEIEAKRLEAAGLLGSDPVPALYQSGYLTIKDYDPLFKTYTLDYPNEEVRNGFISYLVPFYIESTGNSGRFSIKKFVTALSSGDTIGFMTLLESMIAGVPYSEKGSAEAHFQNACYLLFTLMGQFVNVEDRTSNGRIDLTVETPGYIYIFEFKIDSTPEEAMKQIYRKEYWLKYNCSDKDIILIGANFDTHTRRISSYSIGNP
ncbi:MAG: ATP-binding protein, partial [Muribaculaceae bacterium]|nr:ATP-binding protein [Muribaculaceae bacterium]